MIVIDTNVVSELMKSLPSKSVLGWFRAQDRAELYTTSVTVAEIQFGIERLPDGHRKQSLQSTASQTFASFPERILPFDVIAAGQYATLVSARERAGAPIDGIDAQIAAICRTQRAGIATRNVDDFRNTGIEIINPWDES